MIQYGSILHRLLHHDLNSKRNPFIYFLSAAKSNHIKFGDCSINEPHTMTFTMTNHSTTDCVRFSWPEHPQLTFSPALGHLHPNRTKDFTITFNSDQPRNFTEQEVPCKVTKIAFSKPLHEVCLLCLQCFKWGHSYCRAIVNKVTMSNEQVT